MVILGKRYLISDRNIAALSKKERVFEHDFIDAVRGFNLRDALIAIGRASLEIHLSKSPFKVGRAALKDPSTSVIVTQHSLAYIANILIISGANDFKNKRLKVRDDLLSLCNIYYCSIVEPLLQEDENSSDQEQLRSFLIRMYVEQMELQFSPAYMIARTVLLFNHIANRVPPTRFPPLNEIMLEEAGISLFDYLRMGAISFSLLSTARRSGFWQLHPIPNSNRQTWLGWYWTAKFF